MCVYLRLGGYDWSKILHSTKRNSSAKFDWSEFWHAEPTQSYCVGTRKFFGSSSIVKFQPCDVLWPRSTPRG